MARDLDAAASGAAQVRQEIYRRGGFDAGKSADAVEQRAGEGGPLRRLAILRDGERQLGGQHIFGTESGAGAL